MAALMVTEAAPEEYQVEQNPALETPVAGSSSENAAAVSQTQTRGRLMQVQAHGVVRLGHAVSLAACSDRLAVPEELVVLVVAAVASADL
jgi:LDH2 family malate/lactate/ureidoglycolate dehydrogenase